MVSLKEYDKRGGPKGRLKGKAKGEAKGVGQKGRPKG